MTSSSITIERRRTFWILWCGQLVSLLGSGITQFALAVWAFQRSGSAAQFGVIAMCSVLPGLLLSPLAGVFVDRWNRRTAMLVANTGAVLPSAAIAMLLALDRIELWHIFIATSLVSGFTAFHWPAYIATTTLLVPKEQLGRASGAVQAADAVAELAAPVLGGILLAGVGLVGVFALDLGTFVFATTTLLGVRIPPVPRSRRPPAPSIGRETVEAWRYLTARRGLVGLLALSCISSLTIGFLEVLSAPVVLSLASPAALGAVRSVAGVGMLAGSVVMHRWGGPRTRVVGVIRFQVALGAYVVLMGFPTTPWLLAVAGFGALFSLAMVNGCAQPLWQTKVLLHMQGRMFALRRLARAFRPLGHVAAGYLAARFLEPLMSDGSFAGVAGRLVGVGPGRGSALLLVLVGSLTIAATLVVSRYRPLRDVQHELPDVH